MRSSFDTIVVGAGAAGCVLVNRLTEDPGRSVLLIEAGPDFPTVSSLPDEIRLAYTSPSGQIARSYDWAYPAKLSRRPDWILRGKVVGGSSAVNAQIYLRGLPYDFDRVGSIGQRDLELGQGRAVLFQDLSNWNASHSTALRGR